MEVQHHPISCGTWCFSSQSPRFQDPKERGISDPISKSGKSDLMVGKTCNMIFYGIGPQGSITTLV